MRKGFIIVLCVLCIWGMVGCKAECEKLSPEEQKYQEAEMNYEQGEWKTAQQLYEELGYYSDAGEKAEICYHLSAAQDAYENAISSLKDRLKNPASLQVHSISFEAEYGSGESDAVIRIAIDYSAQNSFGGMTRDTYNDASYKYCYDISRSAFITRFNHYMQNDTFGDNRYCDMILAKEGGDK